MGTFEMSQSAWVKYCSDMKELRAENERLRAALEKYADESNWGDYGGIAQVVFEDAPTPGYSIARAALKGSS